MKGSRGASKVWEWEWEWDVTVPLLNSWASGRVDRRAAPSRRRAPGERTGQLLLTPSQQMNKQLYANNNEWHIKHKITNGNVETEQPKTTTNKNT